MKKIVLLFALALSTLARAQSTTFLVVPRGTYPQENGSSANFGGNSDEMRCMDWVERIGITNATQFVLRIATAAGTSSSLTIYSAGGAAILGTTGVKDWSATGTKTAAALDGTFSATSFSLAAGTQYRLCWCRSGTGGTLVASASGQAAAPFQSWHNTMATHYGIAGTGCSTGSPPSSTGSLNPVSSPTLSDSALPVVIVATNTP